MEGDAGDGQFVRLAETARKTVTIHVDGEAVAALAGDTVLTALLIAGRHVRESEFDDGVRAGFCLMGACQDCWISREDGLRLRACTSYITDGMRLCTKAATA